MKNKKDKSSFTNPLIFYFLTLIVSLVLTFFVVCPEGSSWATVLVSIGSSGIAASLIAIFLYVFDLKNKKKQLKLYKKIYIVPIQEEILGLFQKIMWFEDNIDIPEFDWSLRLDDYLKLDFFIFTAKYDTKVKIGLNETIELMNNLSKKYELTGENFYGVKTRKAFQIVYAHSRYLHAMLLNLNNNKIMLDQIGVISLDKVETLLRHYCNLDFVFNSPNGNIGAGIKFLIFMFETLRKVSLIDKVVTPTFAGRY